MRFTAPNFHFLGVAKIKLQRTGRCTLRPTDFALKRLADKGRLHNDIVVAPSVLKVS